MCFTGSTSESRFMAVCQPTCHANHLPPYLEKYKEFKAKGVDVIAVIAANDPFVLSGWGRFEGLEDKVRNAANPDLAPICNSSIRSFQILTLTDTYAAWSKSLGLQLDLTEKGLGIRTGRFAIIVDDLVVKYIQVGLNRMSGRSFQLIFFPMSGRARNRSYRLRSRSGSRRSLEPK